MFSRGNVTEKERFGKRLVQKDDVVLDLYGGIGYFTLPALVHGQAKHVYACEWNKDAVEALLYNLKDNKVLDRASVFHGDCRIVAPRNQLIDKVDRCCLGLLPSSEGGWETAVRALKRSTGGWLHVHANVPAKEVEVWSVWLCSRMAWFVTQLDEGRIAEDWIVRCVHVQKVKSFAPTVNHYVADVFVGPKKNGTSLLPLLLSSSAVSWQPGASVRTNGEVVMEPIGTLVTVPSCALSPNGQLHQTWMREIEQPEVE